MLLIGALSGCGSADQLESLGGPTMGSTWSVKYVRSPGGPKPADVQPEVEKVLAEVDLQMSTYRSDSDIERFNHLPANRCQVMPAGVLQLVRFGEQLSIASQGSYDLTVEPLLDLWGFGPQARIERVPTPEQVAQVLQRVGHGHLRIDGDQLCKDAPVEVDFNSIAAGYAVDLISARLQALGISSFLAEATGELKAVGKKPDGTPWRVALEAPRDDQQVAQKLIDLDGYGVSTSGDYRNYFEQGGQRYSHTFDALSGAPVVHALTSVTVIDPSALRADGLSTLLLILGPERAWDHANEHKIAAFFVIRADKRFIIRSSPEFDRLFAGKSQ